MCPKRKEIIVDKLLGANCFFKFPPTEKKTKPTRGRLACFVHTLTPLLLDKLVFCVDNL
jgi:hypothetical protein